MKNQFDNIDKEILEAIGRSAEDIEVPDRLKPENIKSLLNKSGDNTDKESNFSGDPEEENEQVVSDNTDTDNIVSISTHQKKHINWRRLTSAAAVAAFALIAIPVGLNSHNLFNTAEESNIEAASEESFEESMVASMDTSAAGAPAPQKNKKKISLKKAFKGYFYTEDSVDKVEEKLKKLRDEQAGRGYAYYKVGNKELAMEESAEDIATADGGANGTTTIGATSNDASGNAGSGHDYSTTNLREMGVDEGDIVKTDGDYIYAMNEDGTVRIIKADGAKLTLACSFEPEYDDVDDFRLDDMYISGDKLILVSDTYTVFFRNILYDYDTEDIATDTPDDTTSVVKDKKDGYKIQNTDKTIVAVYDISDRTSPKKIGDYSVDGNYQSSRIADGIIYLFTWYREGNIPFICGDTPDAKSIYLPREGSFYQAFTMTSVALDTPGKAVDTKVIYSGCNDVYVTNDTVILEVSDYTGSHDVTNLFRFNIDAGKFSPAGVGTVPGYIESSFSIDEDNSGNIRVATTTWGYNRNSSGVYVFNENMKRIGKLTGIAKGEDIQSARFMDDMLYLVTYENKDPLFSIDLSDPTNPTIVGQLDLPGFSDYLHFWDDTHLLGIGYDSNEKTGEILGAKLSLFDISNPKKVKEVAHTVIKGVDSIDGMYNYRALLVNPAKNLIGFNSTDWDYESEDYSETHRYYVFSLNDKLTKFEKQAAIKTYEDDGWEDVRGLYIDETFYVVTGKNIRSFDMTKNYTQGEDVLKF